MDSIRIVAEKQPLQFLITDRPVVVLDGGDPFEIPWKEEVAVPAGPGQHSVRISYPYMGKLLGEAQTSVAGGGRVQYRSPLFMWSSGSIKTTG